MTVKELIARLQTMPQDAMVIQDYCSDFRELDDDQPKLIKAEEKRLCLRGGRCIDYEPRQWSADEKPVFVSAVYF